MMKPGQCLPVLIAVVMVNLPACGYIKRWFPDKEKDYQYTTEIPPLVVPSELTDKPVFKQSNAVSDSTDQAETTVDNQRNEPSEPETHATGAAAAPVDEGSSVKSESRTPEPVQPEIEPQVAEPVRSEPESKVDEQASGEPDLPAESVEQSAQNKDKKTGKTQADLVVYDDGETRMRIGAEKATAWRMVGKALSRRSIEVIDRNQEEGSFNVRYDPNEQQFEDESLWDEIKFIFGGFDSHDKQYQLKLIENNRQTDVAILDQDGKPVSNGAGLRLLKLMQKTINADQAK